MDLGERSLGLHTYIFDSDNCYFYIFLIHISNENTGRDSFQLCLTVLSVMSYVYILTNELIAGLFNELSDESVNNTCRLNLLIRSYLSVPLYSVALRSASTSLRECICTGTHLYIYIYMCVRLHIYVHTYTYGHNAYQSASCDMVD